MSETIIPFEASFSCVEAGRAERINAAHARVVEGVKAVITATRSTLEAAIEAGFELEAAKAELPHGAYLAWLEENCPTISHDTARDYRRCAANYEHARNFIETNPAASIRMFLAVIDGKRDKDGENTTLRQLLLPGTSAEPVKAGVLGELKPDTKIGAIRNRLLEFVESPKATEEEFQALLNLWEKISEKLQERGLLTEDLKPAQQLAA